MGSEEDGHESYEDTQEITRNRSLRTFSFHDYKIPPRKTLDFTLLQNLVIGYQSLGVVYGDIGTSPLYVFSSITLSEPGEKDILGILSLISWTLTMMGMIKYVFIVLHADDHGEGGTFALYSLLCQHVNFNGKMMVSTERLSSDLNLQYLSKGSKLQSKAKKLLEENSKVQALITFIVLLGTCMVIGDGALTPAISVLSAVQGIQSRSTKITQRLMNDFYQRFGTSKVSFSFSPIMVLWFSFSAAIGLYNIIKFYPLILKAMSPHYIIYFFQRNHRKGWELLGAIALCITGAEAMLADLGHFNKRGIQPRTLSRTQKKSAPRFIALYQNPSSGTEECPRGYTDEQRLDEEECVSSIVARLKEIAANAQEVEMLNSASCEDVIFVLGRIILNASKKNGCFKKWVVNKLYRFLQKNFRSNAAALRIPPSKSLQMEML